MSDVCQPGALTPFPFLIPLTHLSAPASVTVACRVSGQLACDTEHLQIGDLVTNEAAATAEMAELVQSCPIEPPRPL